MECFRLEQSEGSERKIRTVKVPSPIDPRSIPPCSLNQETFFLKFPLITLCTSMDGDKFESSSFMDSEAFILFVNYIYFSLEKHQGVWFGVNGPMSSEVSGMPLQLMFVECFCKLSKAYFLYKEIQKKTVDLEKAQKDITEEGKEEEEDEIVSTYIEVGGKWRSENVEEESAESTTSSESSIEGLPLNHEENIGREVPYIVIKTFSKTFLKEQELHPLEERTVPWASMLKGWRIVAIIKFIDEYLLNETDAGFYQAASYAIDLATQNIDVHKGKQIPLLLCGNEKWCHGSLTVHGNVIVNDECKMQSDTINDMVAVTKLFEKRVKELRKYALNNEEVFEPDNYVVGELYIDTMKFRRSWKYENLDRDDYRLIHSLLRTVLGDSILQINGKDAHEIIEICKELGMTILDTIERAASRHGQEFESWKTDNQR